MINYYLTKDGATLPIEECCDGCWINVTLPSLDEINFLTKKFNIPEEFFNSALDEEETSHIDTEEDKTLIIIDMPHSETIDDETIYYTTPIGIILTPKNIITVCTKEHLIIRELALNLVKDVNTAHKTQFLLHILYRMATRYLQYINLMERKADTLEKQLRKSMKNEQLVQLLDMQKSFVYFHTSLKSTELTLSKIMRTRNIKLYEEDQDLLEDVMIEIKQAIEMSTVYLNILSETMDAFASVISNNLNNVMRLLAAITLVLSIPTMIFSFYGMNIGEGFAGALPFANNILFPLILSALSIIICILVLFRKPRNKK